MSYVATFAVDIFLSYAHADALADAPPPRWAPNFHEALVAKLNQLGVKAEVFFDQKKLTGSDYLDAALEKHLKSSAILVSIVSPAYAGSEWCLKEFQVFCDAAERSGGIRKGDKSRVVKIIKRPLDEEPDHPLPPLLAQPRGPGGPDSVDGYFFYQIGDDGLPMEMTARHKLYMMRINQVATQIKNVLKLLLKESQAGGAAEVAGVAKPAPRATVYLAPSADPPNEEYEQLRGELQQRNVALLPDVALSYTGDLRRQVRELLRRAQISVHPIGAEYAVPPGETQSASELQLALAAEPREGPALKRVIWIPQGLVAKDDRQRAFIERLRNDAAVQAGAEFLETPIDAVKSVLRQLVEEAGGPAAPAPAAGDDGRPTVYLISDRQDREATGALAQSLTGRGCRTLLPVVDGIESDIVAAHEAHLRECTAALVYCGAAGPEWLKAQLDELEKAPGYGRSVPFSAATAAVYFGPPAASFKRGFQSSATLTVIGPLDTVSPDALATLVAGWRITR